MPTTRSVVDERLDDLAGELIAMDGLLERLHGVTHLTTQTACILADTHVTLLDGGDYNDGPRKRVVDAATDAISATTRLRDIGEETRAAIDAAREIVGELRRLRPRVQGRRDLHAVRGAA